MGLINGTSTMNTSLHWGANGMPCWDLTAPHRYTTHPDLWNKHGGLQPIKGYWIYMNAQGDLLEMKE